MISCLSCQKLFSSQKTLKRHNKIVHKQKQHPNSMKYYCSKCTEYFNYNSCLRKHLQEMHQFENLTQILNFENFTDFTEWLAKEECNGGMQYVKVTGTKKSGRNSEKMYFDCIRSHSTIYTPMEGSRKRAVKSQGSCKMSVACPSQIVVTKNLFTTQYSVVYYKSHNHNMEIQHLHIPKLERVNIASKLIVGVPPKEILNSTRENINENLKRVDLLTGKDIRNIKRAYKIDLKDGCYHKDDATSVDMWVNKCLRSDNNPVLFYKPQGQHINGFEDKDFCLIIMNGVQQNILTRFGNRVITIDGTHGLNSYDFELTTLLTRDEFGNGFPTSFMFSNRKDTFIYQFFFSKIKETVGCIATETFMSDITNTFYNAWCIEMGPAKHQLFCAWHVDRAWQVNLSKITNLEKRSWIYKSLKYLQYLLNHSEFEKNVNVFLEKLVEDEETINFGHYFVKNYVPIIKKWAYCYRVGCGLNTNMHLESFHKTLKYTYLNGKKIKRIDKSIHNLILFIRDKTVERIIKLKKGKNMESNIISKHQLAITSQFSIVQLNNTWIVENSDKSDSYIVQCLSQHICCPIKCSICNICIHTYSCTCIDFSIKTTICKHIHYVVVMNDGDNSGNRSREQSFEQFANDNEVETKVLAHKLSVDGSQIKDKIKLNALKVVQILDTQDLGNEQLKLMLGHQNACITASMIKLTNFEVTKHSNEPENKNILKQVSFYSTKRKEKKKKNISKASSEEINVVKKFLNNELFISETSDNDHKYV